MKITLALHFYEGADISREYSRLVEAAESICLFLDQYVHKLAAVEVEPPPPVAAEIRELEALWSSDGTNTHH